jgi:hypothetical protein
MSGERARRTQDHPAWVRHGRAGPRIIDTGLIRADQGRQPMNIDLARWQFAFTSVNRFFFLPVTLGLVFLWGSACCTA